MRNKIIGGIKSKFSFSFDEPNQYQSELSNQKIHPTLLDFNDYKLFHFFKI